MNMDNHDIDPRKAPDRSWMSYGYPNNDESVNAKKLYSSMWREFLALIKGDPRAFELPLLGEGQALYKQTTLQAPPNSHSACLSPLNYVSNVFITNVVEKLVFQDKQGNVISKTDGVLLGKIVWRQISRSDTTFG